MTYENIFKSFARRQWLAFILCGSMYFVSDSVYSLQGPLYPIEAEKRNVAGEIYGLVLGIYEIVQICVVPLASTVAPSVGPMTTFNLGVLLAGSGTIAFGFLNTVSNVDWFIGLSFLFRIIQAIGEGGIYITVFSWIGTEFPNAVGQVFGAMETVFGSGSSLAPSIGSALYALGDIWGIGYTLPFLLIGGLHFVLAAFKNGENSSGHDLDQTNETGTEG